MIISRKRLEEEKAKAIMEITRERRIDERFEALEHRMFELEREIYDVRMKVDGDFKKQNTPVCERGQG